MTPSLTKLLAQGESKTLEFKRSTGELREAMQTICAFANSDGGRVVIGVRPNGELVGQQVSDQTFHEIAAARDSLEPPVDFEVEKVRVNPDHVAIVLTVTGSGNSVPHTYDGRAYERVDNTTRKMSQERYEALLLKRAHGRRRWENQEADGLTIKDLDRQEVQRIVEAARSTGRLVAPVRGSLPMLLDRLGVRHQGKVLQAAVVLFGKTFLPDYPQCELRMARFRGTDKTEFLDQRNLRAPAFKLLEEAELFCQRHFPLPGRIESGKLQRVDRPLIPPDAMREILVNALVHRDYSIAGGAVSLAIFDDRVEIWSAGKFPAGITPESLQHDHLSVQRNPIIADIFHRAGLIEKWGRGTNRVAEMCRAANVKAPEFAEITGAAVVTFRVPVAMADAADRGGIYAAKQRDRGELGSDRGELGSDWGELGSDRGELTVAERNVLAAIGRRPRKAKIRRAILELMELRAWRPAELAKALHFSPVKVSERHLSDMVAEGLLERSHPKNPTHPAQAYRAAKVRPNKGRG